MGWGLLRDHVGILVRKLVPGAANFCIVTVSGRRWLSWAVDREWTGTVLPVDVAAAYADYKETTARLQRLPPGGPLAV